jgi:hypothetical protein
MRVYVVHVVNGGGDHYLHAFRKKPDRKQIVEMIWELEGKEESIEDYNECLSIDIQRCEVLK